MTFGTRFWLATVAVLVAALGTAVVSGDHWLRATVEHHLVEEAERDVRLVAAGIPRAASEQQTTIRSLGLRIGRRLTVIDSTGRVIADSDFEQTALRMLDNHLTRPEVAEALRSGLGRSTRYSESTQREELKLAIRAWPGVVRISVPTNQVDETVADAQRAVLAAALVGLLIGTLLAAGGGRAIAQPLGQLTGAARALAAGKQPVYPNSSAPEIRQLVLAFRAMQHELDERMETVRRRGEETSAIVDAMVEGVIATDPDGRILRCNRAARELFHFGPDEELPPVRTLFRNPDARELIDRILAGAAVLGHEIDLDGRTVLVTAHPLATAGSVITLHDITTVRRLETVRRDFVANVSHELKTPLTNIAGYAETLRDEEIEPAVRQRFVEIIATHTGRMQRLVDDLLDLARLESGAWHPSRAAVHPVEIARAVWATLASRANDRGVVFQASDSDMTVAVDPDAFRQILTNLFDNAVRHTNAGGTITFSVGRKGGLTELAIADNGVGIPAEHLPRVFERFYRVDPGRSREQGGTGLGLSIVRHLTEAHGGHVELESAIGIGTTVKIVLPDQDTS